MLLLLLSQSAILFSSLITSSELIICPAKDAELFLGDNQRHLFKPFSDVAMLSIVYVASLNDRRAPIADLEGASAVALECALDNNAAAFIADHKSIIFSCGYIRCVNERVPCSADGDAREDIFIDPAAREDAAASVVNVYTVAFTIENVCGYNNRVAACTYLHSGHVIILNFALTKNAFSIVVYQNTCVAAVGNAALRKYRARIVTCCNARKSIA